MKEVFLTLFTAEEEKQIGKERWKEILKEFMTAARNKKEYRIRLSGALALSDYLIHKEWDEIKEEFHEIFDLAFHMLEDVNEKVATASLNLLKTLKQISL
jgi:alkyl hydroperoxide reductase subunit AhpC